MLGVNGMAIMAIEGTASTFVATISVSHSTSQFRGISLLAQQEFHLNISKIQVIIRKIDSLSRCSIHMISGGIKIDSIGNWTLSTTKNLCILSIDKARPASSLLFSIQISCFLH